MAVYKVIQDIESEDKLFGPLTLKGFIYVAIAGVLLFIDIRLLVSSVSWLVKLLFIILFLPPMLLFGTLASPLGREQPTEVWLLSHVRFWFKPKIRKWDQSGIKQLVTITAPKKISRILTKNFTPSDVNSRLQALANTLDSRGWVIKNVAIDATPHLGLTDVEASDERLVGATSLIQTEPVLDIHPSDDVLDDNSQTARNMSDMIAQAETERNDLIRAQAEVDNIEAQSQSQPTASEEQAVLDRIHTREAEIKNHPPLGHDSVNQRGQTVKMELANAGNALSVATVAALAKRNADNQTGNINLAQT